ncbi:MAG: oxygen-independent coproporphyrinogen III oxidase [Planctomycetes bacterium]|nr:oxygen-independent coproporphyrinogen III oxidase [Planctomycetota bacterium]
MSDIREVLGVDEATLLRMAGAGPRYTSYPTAPEWKDGFTDQDALAACRRAAQRPGEPLSLYVHLPFCERLCLYCGCTVEIHGHRDRPVAYLDAVEKELEIVAGALGARRDVSQLHWGGGTPTFLLPDQLERLWRAIGRHFRILPGAEVSLEVDPHITTFEQVDLLTSLGFNRVSLGVQDFDPHVQQVVKRDQTFDETEALVGRLRQRGVDGINIDLMYGLPDQSEAGFAATLEKITAMRPDRLAVFGYAHVPWMKPAQKVLEKTARIPQAVERARLFALAVQRLGSAGYELIGLDHFALPTDTLWKVLQEGRMHRNFMGYATAPADEMASFGMSAIGDLGNAFVQNARSTKEYEPALMSGRLATIRGLVRSDEDNLRRAAILSVMCRMRLDLDELERQTGRADLAGHFAVEWGELQRFVDEGFARWASARRFEVLPRGRLFLRHMAMVFDESLRRQRGAEDGGKPRFSQTV